MQRFFFPYLIGDDLLEADCTPSRYVIDFHPRDMVAASPIQRTI